MYKMNLLLKFIFVILTISIVVITNNRIVLWLLLLVLTYYHLNKNRKILLFIDLILVILLALSKDNNTPLLLFKLLYIINFVITIYKSLSIDDKKILVRENPSSKLDFFEDNFQKVVDNLNEKKIGLYDENTSIDSRIERELERKYLQSKIRFYNSSSSNNNYYNWNTKDTLFLLFILVIFVILFILR